MSTRSITRHCQKSWPQSMIEQRDHATGTSSASHSKTQYECEKSQISSLVIFPNRVIVGFTKDRGHSILAGASACTFRNWCKAKPKGHARTTNSPGLSREDVSIDSNSGFSTGVLSETSKPLINLRNSIVGCRAPHRMRAVAFWWGRIYDDSISLRIDLKVSK